MPAHPQAARRLHKRQDPPPVPTASGITGATSVADSQATAGANSLLLDTSAAASTATFSVPPIAASIAPVVSETPTSSVSSAASAEPSSSSSGSSSDIPIGSVVSAVVGSIIGVIVLIIFAVRCNRRLSRLPKSTSRSPTSPSDARNANGEHARRRSRLEPWAKLDDASETKEVADSAAMEKLTMFKKSPSLRSGDSEKVTSDGGHEIDLGGPPAFAKYHPQLAEELAKTPQRQFLGRVDAGAPISWGDADTLGDESFLSFRDSKLNTSHLDSMASTGSVTSSAVVRNTPAATIMEHNWQSAEVMHYEGEGETGEVQNPFADEPPVERRKSQNNPFFSGRDSHQGKRSRSRSRSQNPFTDAHAARAPAPISTDSRLLTHTSTDSSEQAMQSLIAALDVSPGGALRGHSMQPSVVRSSVMTGYTDRTDDIEGAFPLPPTGPQYSSSQ
ncbi:hypothetical protein PLICRDRAFT_91032 [Plicaturopsis crispa FD-325 SS-3]|nr:hypothetical protein PLICRDRAFT_91032 [Plicaturopsis crispa FD-325 SS-3]